MTDAKAKPKQIWWLILNSSHGTNARWDQGTDKSAQRSRVRIGYTELVSSRNSSNREQTEADEDFAEVDLGPDPTAEPSVVVHNENVLPNAIAILRENGFINIDNSDKRRLRVVKPRLTIQQEEDLENQVIRLGKNSMSKVSSIKADVMQRLTAAIKAEYIDPPVAQKARVQLDELGDEARNISSFFR